MPIKGQFLEKNRRKLCGSVTSLPFLDAPVQLLLFEQVERSYNLARQCHKNIWNQSVLYVVFRKQNILKTTLKMLSCVVYNIHK